MADQELDLIDWYRAMRTENRVEESADSPTPVSFDDIFYVNMVERYLMSG